MSMMTGKEWIRVYGSPKTDKQWIDYLITREHELYDKNVWWCVSFLCSIVLNGYFVYKYIM